jgi:DNA-directed RNA polymerase subunit RPC12/RpoP
MNCPGCATEMTHLAFEGRLGTTIEIDLCSVCRAIWFDHFEELRLTPGATLKVFGVISEPADRPTTLFPTALHCPRCNGRLLLTHDMQRSTPFQYWRCDSGHGRLITFVDFLREKDFVRPLTPQQLEELRQNIQTINCSNCGAAINLVKDSVCAHCGSAVSMLDLQQMARTVGQLRAAVSGSQAADGPPPSAVPRGQSDPSEIEALVQAFKTAGRTDSPPGLIETGLGLLGRLLR